MSSQAIDTDDRSGIAWPIVVVVHPHPPPGPSTGRLELSTGCRFGGRNIDLKVERLVVTHIVLIVHLHPR